MIETYVPLYRKYRPQALGDLVGQEVVSTAVGNALALGKIAHAYLFCGPRGTGKTSSARILAKSLNCEIGPTATPCQTCPSCTSITAGNALDVTEIDAASNNSVDDIRDLTDKVQFSPLQGKYKIYIIDEVHMLSNAAFNALLKTLEEPPPSVVFIFATTEPHKVLPTIISRCQRFDFARITRPQIEGRLNQVAEWENIRITPEAVSLIARHARGGLRDALGLLDQVAVLGKSDASEGIQPAEVRAFIGVLADELLYNLTQGLIDRAPEVLLGQIRVLQEKGVEPTQLVKELTHHFRNLLIAKACGTSASGDSFDIDPDLYPRLCTQAENFTPAEIPQILNRLSLLESQLRHSHQPQLWLEVALLDICYRQDIHLLHELAERVAALEGGRVSSAAAPASRPTPPQPRQQAAPQPTPAAAPMASLPTPPVAMAPVPMAESPLPLVTPSVPDMAPVAAPVPVSASPAPEPQAIVASGNLDTLWFQIIQSISHIPTQSLLKDHFHIMDLSETLITIGYTKNKATILDAFRNNPAKVDYFVQAAQEVTGKTYKLTFRQVDEAPVSAAPSTQPAPMAPPPAAYAPAPQMAPPAAPAVLESPPMAYTEPLPAMDVSPLPVAEASYAAPTPEMPPEPQVLVGVGAETEMDDGTYEIDRAKKYTQELLMGKVLD